MILYSTAVLKEEIFGEIAEEIRFFHLACGSLRDVLEQNDSKA